MKSGSQNTQKQPIELSAVQIDPNLPPQERLQSFLEQLGGEPYQFRSGKLTIELVFDPQGEPLDKILLRQLEEL